MTSVWRTVPMSFTHVTPPRDQLEQSEPRRGGDRRLGVRGLERPDALAQPAQQVALLGEPAEQRLAEMEVTVDEAGQHERARARRSTSSARPCGQRRERRGHGGADGGDRVVRRSADRRARPCRRRPCTRAFPNGSACCSRPALLSGRRRARRLVRRARHSHGARWPGGAFPHIVGDPIETCRRRRARVTSSAGKIRREPLIPPRRAPRLPDMSRDASPRPRSRDRPPRSTRSAAGARAAAAIRSCSTRRRSTRARAGRSSAPIRSRCSAARHYARRDRALARAVRAQCARAEPDADRPCRSPAARWATGPTTSAAVSSGCPRSRRDDLGAAGRRARLLRRRRRVRPRDAARRGSFSSGLPLDGAARATRTPRGGSNSFASLDSAPAIAGRRRRAAACGVCAALDVRRATATCARSGASRSTSRAATSSRPTCRSAGPSPRGGRRHACRAARARARAPRDRSSSGARRALAGAVRGVPRRRRPRGRVGEPRALPRSCAGAASRRGRSRARARAATTRARTRGCARSCSRAPRTAPRT